VQKWLVQFRKLVRDPTRFSVRSQSRLRRTALLSLTVVILVSACGDGALAPPPPDEPSIDLAEGQRLFDRELFGGNGRTCVTCHTRANGTITLAMTG
jgi:mono/diheme cytochrome c family protein